MRHRIGPRNGPQFDRSGATGLEHLEQRQLLAADLAGVRLILDAGGQTAEVRQWTGEHDPVNGGSTTDPIRYRLTVNEQYSAGATDRTAPTATNWSEFVLDPSGELGVNYKSGTPYHVGSSFRDDDGFGMGWLIEGAGADQQALNFLHELPTAATIPDLNGSWHFSAIALSTSGSGHSAVIAGAYGTFNVNNLIGSFTYSANLIGDTQSGSGAVQSLALNGLGKITDADYFAISKDRNSITAVDLAYGDGMTYIVTAVRRGSTLTSAEVAGQYRFGAALTATAAQERGADLIALEGVYLKLNTDGTLTAYDLADWDNGTETVVHTGQWNLLPEGRTVLITYEDIGEAHLVAFGADKNTFIDLRVNHGSDASYVLGQGQRVAEAGGGGGGGGGDSDDHADDGDYDNATTITINSTGAGAATGEIETDADTDLFRMTATVTGAMTVVLSTAGGDLTGVLTIKDQDGNVLATKTAAQSAVTVQIQRDVAEGDQLFIVVGADGATAGVYSLVITTDDGSGGGGGGDYVDDYGADDDGSNDDLLDPADVPFPRLTIAGRAPTGRQAVWERGTDSKWYYSKLGLRTDTPGIIGELVTWVDEQTDEFKVAAATESGMILWVRDEESGVYHKHNLTEEAEGDNAEIPTAQVAYIRLDDGRNVLASLNDVGDVIAYVESQGSSFMVNLSQAEIRDKDKEIPALHGALTGGVSAWGTTIIAGLDADGKVWTVWFSLQGNDGWEASPLSNIAGADPIAGSLSIYFTSWNGINVAGLDDQGQTQVLWWVPSFKGNWEVSNLTDKFDGPTFKAGTMTTYTTPWNALTIVGVTEDSRMVAYWWAPGFSKWEIADFSALLPQNQPRVIRGPITASIRPSNDIWLFGRDADDNMTRIVWTRSTDDWTSALMTTGAQQF